MSKKRVSIKKTKDESGGTHSRPKLKIEWKEISELKLGRIHRYNGGIYSHLSPIVILYHHFGCFFSVDYIPRVNISKARIIRVGVEDGKVEGEIELDDIPVDLTKWSSTVIMARIGYYGRRLDFYDVETLEKIKEIELLSYLDQTWQFIYRSHLKLTKDLILLCGSGSVSLPHSYYMILSFETGSMVKELKERGDIRRGGKTILSKSKKNCFFVTGMTKSKGGYRTEERRIFLINYRRDKLVKKYTRHNVEIRYMHSFTTKQDPDGEVLLAVGKNHIFFYRVSSGDFYLKVRKTKDEIKDFLPFRNQYILFRLQTDDEYVDTVRLYNFKMISKRFRKIAQERFNLSSELTIGSYCTMGICNGDIVFPLESENVIRFFTYERGTSVSTYSECLKIHEFVSNYRFFNDVKRKRINDFFEKDLIERTSFLVTFLEENQVDSPTNGDRKLKIKFLGGKEILCFKSFIVRLEK